MYSPVFNGILEKGISRTLTYDTDYLLTDIVDNDGSSTSPLDWYYAYDANANIELIRDDLDSSNTQDFFYDKLNRLETAAGSYGDIAYSYDNVGNRLTKLHTDGGVTRKETYTYSYQTGMPDSHQLETIAVDLTNDGVDDEARNFAYDVNGNLIIDDQATNPDFDLTYNSHQRYEQLDIGGALTATYQHNALGQRVQKTTTEMVHYHYDESGRLIGETDQLGNAKDYVYVNDMRVARYDNATAYYFHNDHLGRPIALTNQSKAVVWQAEYLPFGQVYVLNNNTIDNELGFPGQILDEESGFYYNYFRDYDPSTGRYIQADPIGILEDVSSPGLNVMSYVDKLIDQRADFSDGRGLNHNYAYVMGNPVTLSDEFGLSVSQTDHLVYSPETNCSCTKECKEKIIGSGKSILVGLVCGKATVPVFGGIVCNSTIIMVCGHICRDDCNQCDLDK